MIIGKTAFLVMLGTWLSFCGGCCLGAPLFQYNLNPDPVEESIFVHLSDQVLITGEVMWLNVTVKIDGLPSPSKVVYAELLDREGNPVNQQMMGMEKGQSTGYLDIPNRLKSDIYLLRVYTRNSPYATNENKIFHQFITVINPEIPPNIQELNLTTKTTSQAKQNLQIDKTRFKSGEEIKLHLPARPADHLNVSVAYHHPGLHHETSVAFETMYGMDFHTKPEIVIPELYGHIVKGRWLEEKLDTLQTFYLSAHGNQSHLFLGKSNEKGEFFFETGAFYHFDYVVVQSSKTQEQVNFLLDSPFWEERPREGFIFPQLVLSANEKAFLQDRLLAKAMKDYYTPAIEQSVEKIPFQFISDHSYLLDDYNRFDDMATVIREYVPHVLVRSQNKNTVFKNFNIPYNRVFQENPLLLIDAMPVFESDVFAKFNPKDIKKMDILNRYVYFQNEIYNGIVSLTSFENDFGKFDLPKNALFIAYEGLQLPKSPLVELSQTESGSRFPDFRNLLLWENRLPVSPREPTIIHFDASNLKGDFEVSVSYWDTEARTWKEESGIIHIE
jgi:hypothetical protein